MSSQLIVVRQESLAEESYIHNGQPINVHVVAKSISFLMLVGSLNDAIDFHEHILSAKLVYDCGRDCLPKEVAFVNQKPLEYKAHVNNEGTTATVEIKIFVLSSQHENQFFRVQLSLDELGIATYSSPVRVISKPNLLNKEKKPSKKRHISEVVSNTGCGSTGEVASDILERLQQQQQAQLTLLQDIAKMNAAMQSNLHSLASEGKAASSLQSPPVDFEAAFKLMLDSYNTLPSDLRRDKLRKMLDESTSDPIVSDFLTHCWGASDRMPTAPSKDVPMAECSTEAPCTCANCPYKKEMAAMDSFFSEFLGTDSR